MKKQWKWLIALAVFVALLAAAGILYRHLSRSYTPQIPSAPAATQASAAETEPLTALPTESAEFVANEPDAVRETETATATAAVPETTASTTAAAAVETAADFTVTDADGNSVQLSEHFGKPVVVNLWASWCGPCRSELPAFDAAAKANEGKIDFMMVDLTDGYSETVETGKQFIDDMGYTFPVYFDTEESAAEAYNVRSIPMTLFIRADGSLLTSHIGAMDEGTLQSYLSQLTQ